MIHISGIYKVGGEKSHYLINTPWYQKSAIASLINTHAPSPSPPSPDCSNKTAQKPEPKSQRPKDSPTPKREKKRQKAWSDGLLHLGDVQLDMGVHLQVLVVRGVDLIFDVFFQVGHLFFACAMISQTPFCASQGNRQGSREEKN